MFDFFLLHVDVLLSQYHLLKRVFCPHWIILGPMYPWWNQLIINMRLWILNYIPVIWMPILTPVLNCNFLVSFKFGSMSPLNFYFFSLRLLWCSHIIFGFSLSISAKKLVGILIEIAFNRHQFGEYCHFNSIMSFHPQI